MLLLLEEMTLAGQSVTSGPQDVMVLTTSLDLVTVEVAALTEATAAAMMATVENCILDMSERLVVRMSDTEEKKRTNLQWEIVSIYTTNFEIPA